MAALFCYMRQVGNTSRLDLLAASLMASHIIFLAWLKGCHSYLSFDCSSVRAYHAIIVSDEVLMNEKTVIICVSVLGFLILLPFVVLCFNPWSEIMCCHEEINIQTAQVRYSRYVYFVKVTEQTEDTGLSDHVEISGDNISSAFWRRANTFSPLASHSPHYSFHGALAQVHQLQTAFSLKVLSEAEKKQAVEGLLKKWRESDDCHSAGQYVDDLLDGAIEKYGY